MLFLNVAGIRNKDKEFWEAIKEWDIVIMMETWLDEGGWKKIRTRLLTEFRWKVQIAKRKNRKRRACGGMLIGTRKGIKEERIIEEKREVGVMECIVKIGEERWRIVGVYINGDIERKLEILGDWIDGREDEIKTLIGGNFNARTREEEGWKDEEEYDREKKNRKSKDKKMNREEKKLIEFIQGKGWVILNGNTKGDEEGKFMHTGGKGETVIDYILGDKEEEWK